MRACLAALLAVALVGCGSEPLVRECTTSADCLQDGVAGQCLDSPASGSQWCAFADVDCAGGLKWGLLAGDGLRETCVAAADGGVVDATGAADAADPVTLTVLLEGAGAGTVTSVPAGVDCGATCIVAFDRGTEIVLTAVPAAGSSFAGWGNGCTGSGTCQVVLDGDVLVSATFDRSGDAYWVRQHGTSSKTAGEGIAVAADGSVFVVGFDYGISPEAGVVLVRKYDGDGVLLWSREFSSAPGYCYYCGAYDIIVDNAGDAIVLGKVSEAIDFDGTVLDTAGDTASFLAKLRGADGIVEWAQLLAPTWPYANRDFGIVLDSAGNVIITGSFVGTANLGTFTLTSAGQSDVLVAKLTPAGAVLWARRFGSIDVDAGADVAIDSMNDVVVTGSFSQTMTIGGTALVSAGARDVFMSKLDGSAGNAIWAKRFGNSGEDAGRSVAIGIDDEIIATGAYSGMVGFGGDVFTAPGSYDMFLLELTTTGVHAWSRATAATGNASGESVVLGTTGWLVTGSFEGNADFGGGAVTSAGGLDAFVASYSPGGAYSWARRYGAALTDAGLDVASGAGRIYVTGTFAGSVDFGGITLAASAFTDLFCGAFAP